MELLVADSTGPVSGSSTRISRLHGHALPSNLFIGCAGWSFAKEAASDFVTDGTQLQRYASAFRSVEINSSFHRSHRRSTYERWADSVPESFRFSVKVPKTITHVKKLADAELELAAFVTEATGLGNKLGCFLVQLPPGSEFNGDVATRFFENLRSQFEGDVFLEPRHKTWFTPIVSKLLVSMRIGRVAADPAIVPLAAEPGGPSGKVYFRLHGSPQIYYSSYTTAYLDGLAFRLRAHSNAGGSVWCTFDNTIRGAATANAIYLARKISLLEKGARR